MKDMSIKRKESIYKVTQRNKNKYSDPGLNSHLFLADRSGSYFELSNGLKAYVKKGDSNTYGNSLYLVELYDQDGNLLVGTKNRTTNPYLFLLDKSRKLVKNKTLSKDVKKRLEDIVNGKY